MNATKPPVTQTAQWATYLEPWIRQVEAELNLGQDTVDVDRVHQMTSVVAEHIQRSMAPIASYLVGYAVGRGARIEEACVVVERLCRESDAAPSR
ncbi:hypothetical protein JSY14_02055 [Brachybacterium sp. EF45031]|uniref:DUF6457 domain-containing protein n=1 Tax=Brachybacterium sillae TaxID=2810536 RepID=UPI00217E9E4D|nr:DUF6457 domain-containing protein [Brachybacterium sillae]MCS6710861.1 hypothetical protein [Brachybacterium sillae]